MKSGKLVDFVPGNLFQNEHSGEINLIVGVSRSWVLIFCSTEPNKFWWKYKSSIKLTEDCSL